MIDEICKWIFGLTAITIWMVGYVVVFRWLLKQIKKQIIGDSFNTTDKSSGEGKG